MRRSVRQAAVMISYIAMQTVKVGNVMINANLVFTIAPKVLVNFNNIFQVLPNLNVNPRQGISAEIVVLKNCYCLRIQFAHKGRTNTCPILACPCHAGCPLGCTDCSHWSCNNVTDCSIPEENPEKIKV